MPDPRRVEEGEVLDDRALNRALLARQLLLERHPLTPIQAMERLVGLQAQNPESPYVALWARLRGFRPEDLSTRIAERDAVRGTLMRATIHLVSAGDFLALRPLVQPAIERDVFRNVTFGRERLADLDLQELLDAARDLMDAEERSGRELRTLLGARWPDRDPSALAYAVRALLPLVQVPPRGLWRTSGQPRLMTARAWLGRDPEIAPDLEWTFARYLRAFGPASVADFQAWSGLNGVRGEMHNWRLPLVRLRDGRRRELLDLPDAPRPDPETPAPPRFLPDYDNVLLSHADRSRIVSPEARRRLFSRETVRGALLVDGFVAGAWSVGRPPARSTLSVELFTALPPAAREAVAHEAESLLDLLLPDARARDVAIL